MTLVLHLTTRTDWVTAVRKGEYTHPSLAAESFIHASTAEQVVATANRYYGGRTDLVLLAIDTARLTSEMKWEIPASIGQEFPHIYGPLNLDAVTQALEFKAQADGVFVSLPDGLDQQGYAGSLWVSATNEDESPHWDHPALLGEVTEGLVVTRTGYATIVAREMGHFASTYYTRGHYWPDRWYNVIRLEDANHQLDGFYCNIARPFPFDGKTVRYVDLQLDVRVFAGANGRLSWRVLDEDEFEAARDKYGYSDELVARCWQAVDECIAAIKAREFPFNV